MSLINRENRPTDNLTGFQETPEAAVGTKIVKTNKSPSTKRRALNLAARTVSVVVVVVIVDAEEEHPPPPTQGPQCSLRIPLAQRQLANMAAPMM